MVETLDDLLGDKMTGIELLALVAMTQPKVDRSKLDPTEFFGWSEEVKIICENPTKALQAILQKREFFSWDGKTPFWGAVIEEFKLRCASSRAESMLGIEENRIRHALRVMKEHRVNGNMSLKVVQDARAVLAKAMELVDVVETVAAVEPIATEDAAT